MGLFCTDHAKVFTYSVSKGPFCLTRITLSVQFLRASSTCKISQELLDTVSIPPQNISNLQTSKTEICPSQQNLKRLTFKNVF